MDTVTLELAFFRFGAHVAGRRPLCATATDGSLVLVCQAAGFSRPMTGVLRYASALSQSDAGKAQVEMLRAGLAAASAAQTPVRLIIQTPATGRAPSRVHMRADLVGSVTEFDGDAYSVDFVRVEAQEPEPEPRTNRRR